MARQGEDADEKDYGRKQPWVSVDADRWRPVVDKAGHRRGRTWMTLAGWVGGVAVGHMGLGQGRL